MKKDFTELLPRFLSKLFLTQCAKSSKSEPFSHLLIILCKRGFNGFLKPLELAEISGRLVFRLVWLDLALGRVVLADEKEDGTSTLANTLVYNSDVDAASKLCTFW